LLPGSFPDFPDSFDHLQRFKTIVTAVTRIAVSDTEPIKATPVFASITHRICAHLRNTRFVDAALEASSSFR